MCLFLTCALDHSQQILSYSPKSHPLSVTTVTSSSEPLVAWVLSLVRFTRAMQWASDYLLNFLKSASVIPSCLVQNLLVLQPLGPTSFLVLSPHFLFIHLSPFCTRLSTSFPLHRSSWFLKWKNVSSPKWKLSTEEEDTPLKDIFTWKKKVLKKSFDISNWSFLAFCFKIISFLNLRQTE